MISLKPESPEELRQRLGEMSTLELRRFGERARNLFRPQDELRRDPAARHRTRRGESRMASPIREGETEVRSLPPSQILREMAEEYLHLAAETDGNVDSLRQRNYRWLIKFAEELNAKSRAL
jgi:hypothetical protein